MIQDSDGLEYSKQEDIAMVAIQYFVNLFSAQPVIQTEAVLHDVKPCVSGEMNGELLRPFEASDVKDALFGMCPTKSPEPDGMCPLFFQHFWHEICSDVVGYVLSIIRNAVMPQELNYTHIALIPKIKNPTKISDFRPISLCIVLYKIIAKVLANRMKKFLESIISETQSAFVPGRLITDNIVVSFELVHFMNQQRASNNCNMALKLDMGKAYDRV